MARVRTGFDALLNFLGNRNGDPITLLVSSPSRIARDAELLTFFVETLTGLGATVKVVGAL